MKIIDLLNKIANGEEVNFYVINNGFITEYFYEKGKLLRDDNGEDVEWRIGEDWLNYEAEIIKENKKIEKITTLSVYQSTNLYAHKDKINELIVSINKIIDKINKMENK